VASRTDLFSIPYGVITPILVLVSPCARLCCFSALSCPANWEEVTFFYYVYIRFFIFVTFLRFLFERFYICVWVCMRVQAVARSCAGRMSRCLPCQWTLAMLLRLSALRHPAQCVTPNSHRTPDTTRQCCLCRVVSRGVNWVSRPSGKVWTISR